MLRLDESFVTHILLSNHSSKGKKEKKNALLGNEQRQPPTNTNLTIITSCTTNSVDEFAPGGGVQQCDRVRP